MTQLVDIPFFVLEESEFRIGKTASRPGALIARYLPGMTYRLTNKNQEFVAAMVSEGKAQYGAPRAAAAGLVGQVTGRINLTPRKG